MSDSRVATLLKYSALIVGVLTALAYGALRTAYYQYYSAFRVLPEQAGLDKSDLLSEALIGPFVLVVLISSLLVATGFVLGYVIGYFIDRVVRQDERTPAFFSLARLSGAWSKLKSLGWPVLCGSVALAVVITAGVLIHYADDSADKAIGQHKELLTRYMGWGDFSLPILDVRAQPTEIEWVGGGTGPGVIASAGECMEYLGETADTVLLYDEKDGRTVSFPRDDVVVKIRTHWSGLPTSDGSCPLNAPTGP